MEDYFKQEDTMKTNIHKRNISVFAFTCSLILLSVNWLKAQVPGSNQVALNPKSVPQFVDPLPHFAYPGARVDATTGTPITVKMLPHQQVALSTGTVLNGGTIGITPGVGLTKVWAYQILDGTNTYGPLWPAHTIVAKRGVPLQVTYENDLYGETYANVGLTVDQTLRWADPNGMGRSMSVYNGAPPTVVHLHGAEVSSLYDGGPDAWYTPGNQKVGPSWQNGINTNNYQYVNTQEGATLWFHDHVMGATRLNVYAGLAGFYFLKDDAEDALHLPGWSGDNMVQEIDRVTGNPSGAAYRPDIEVVIQDRMFDTNGQLYFPILPPNQADHPYWSPEFVGDIITVNGKTWPYLSVAPRKYRFHILNGSNARFYELYLQGQGGGAKNGPVIYQIGTDGGLLDAPVAIDHNLGNKLVIGPGERVDVVIDFTGVPNTEWNLKNTGNAPYPNGAPPNGNTVGHIMQFVVNGQLQGADNSLLPAALRTTPLVKLTNFAGGINVTPAKTRQLTLNEVIGPGGPLEVLVNNTPFDGNGAAAGLGVTETPTEGTSEVWQIINLTADAHPIHLHLVQFQLVSRQKFNLNKYLKIYTAVPGMGPQNGYNTPNADGAVGGNPAVTPFLQGPVKPANVNEMGWKDTFIMYPGEVTTVVVRWAPTDMPISTPASQQLFAFDPSEGPGYVWHCHIIDHEDNEMMRPYKVTANPSRLLAKSRDGAVMLAADQKPGKFSLDQNYPNPFNPTTEIHFNIPADSKVELRIFNVLGQLVKTLVNDNYTSGEHSVRWDATNEVGSKVTSGVYIYQLKSGNLIQNRKMVLIK